MNSKSPNEQTLLDGKDAAEILSEVDAFLESLLTAPDTSERQRDEQFPDRPESAPAPELTVSVIKHFACSGGTLFSNCLACAPNTVLMSELEPGVANEARDAGRFAPSDWLYHAGLHKEKLGTEVIDRISVWAAFELIRTAQARGLHIICREHSHSKYCRGTSVAKWTDLHSLLSRFAMTSAIVTVRDPIESFISLRREGWVHYQPATFDEYCKRYISFLDDNSDLPLFKYEDLCSDPDLFHSFANEHLGLILPEDFVDLFITNSVSGNSGQRHDAIVTKEFREISASLLPEIKSAENYQPLISRLNYESRI
jgi:hypothetical protein